MFFKSFLIILNLFQIIVKPVPIFHLWTDTVTNRHGQLTGGDRGRGNEGGGADCGAGAGAPCWEKPPTVCIGATNFPKITL